MGRMKVVIDTDVMVAAIRSSTGASSRIVLLAQTGRFQILVSVPLLFEYEAILKRPQHLKAANFTVEDVDEFIDALATIAIPVSPYYLWRPVLKDPNDEMVLETAVNGQADFILTFNTRHLATGAQRFGIEAIQPGEFLRRITK